MARTWDHMGIIYEGYRYGIVWEGYTVDLFGTIWAMVPYNFYTVFNSTPDQGIPGTLIICPPLLHTSDGVEYSNSEIEYRKKL